MSHRIMGDEASVSGESEQAELALLSWAREHRRDEVVRSFWRPLCSVLGLKTTAGPEEVLRRLRLSGGNTLVNLVRRDGVCYAEIAYDVACRLRGLLRRSLFTRGDVAACERFVLSEMGVTEQNLSQLQRTFGDRVDDVSFEAQVRDMVIDAAAKEAIKEGLRAVEKKVGLTATGELGRQAIQQTGKKAASAAGRAVARQAARKASEDVARYALRLAVSRALISVHVALWAWTVVDLAGPAYRKTIPAVTYIALLRRLSQA
jgi:uncharacterized protein YaaW (UPF0174 family)